VIFHLAVGLGDDVRAHRESTLSDGADSIGKLRRDDRISTGYTSARLLL
jgi:hypothetical protein